MKLYMLYEDRLGPLPPEIKEVQCFDPALTVLTPGGRERLQGRSTLLEGPQEAFIRWLKPFDTVWVGAGQPYEEWFERMHIKEGA
jgi:hypothetical protein